MSSANENSLAMNPSEIEIRQLRLLKEIDKAIVSSYEDLNRILSIILDGSLKIGDANHGQLFILEGNELVVRATTTEPIEKELGKRLDVGNSISGLAVQ